MTVPLAPLALLALAAALAAEVTLGWAVVLALYPVCFLVGFACGAWNRRRG